MRSTAKHTVRTEAEAWFDEDGGDARLVRFTDLPLPQVDSALRGERADATVTEPALTRISRDACGLGEAYLTTNPEEFACIPEKYIAIPTKTLTESTRGANVEMLGWASIQPTHGGAERSKVIENTSSQIVWFPWSQEGCPHPGSVVGSQR